VPLIPTFSPREKEPAPGPLFDRAVLVPYPPVMTENGRATMVRWGAGAVLLALLWSGISPFDRATWMMEVAPVLVVVPLLLLTGRAFPLTTLLYALIAVHALVLIVGGAYTYARVPLGFWLQDAFDLGRNPYDKVGHFMQGLVPALAAREILLRGRHVTGSRMGGFLSVCVALAVSASYELVEWGAALALGQGADEFLGTQGDPWDTQSDMFLALLGALAGVLALGRVQDRQIAALAAR
jgi:putative membrane protein